MWFKMEDGSRVNLDHLSLVKRQPVYRLGSFCREEDIVHYQVAGVYAGDTQPRAVFASKLTLPEADALLGYIFEYITDDPNWQDVNYLLRCIRQEVEPETLDDSINLTETGRACLRAETRELDGNGEAR